jgi:hypothetical protein
MIGELGFETCFDMLLEHHRHRQPGHTKGNRNGRGGKGKQTETQ